LSQHVPSYRQGTWQDNLILIGHRFEVNYTRLNTSNNIRLVKAIAIAIGFQHQANECPTQKMIQAVALILQ
jgi:hypothetical protein